MQNLQVKTNLLELQFVDPVKMQQNIEKTEIN